VPILVFLGLSVLDLGPKYATDRQTDVRKTDVRQTSDVRQHRLMSPIRGEGIITRTGVGKVCFLYLGSGTR